MTSTQTDSGLFPSPWNLATFFDVRLEAESESGEADDDPQEHGSFQVKIPSEFQYHTSEGPKSGYMSRQRTDDLIDHVLRKMPDAPDGTFDHVNGEFTRQEASKWTEGQVRAYLSKHTLESISAEVAPREMKDYEFPEALRNSKLRIDTGVGYYYNPLVSKSFDGECEDGSSKTLNGSHFCWGPGSRFKMPSLVLGGKFDSNTGETTLEVRNAVQVCASDKGQIGPDHLSSFQEHMTNYLNGDDPTIAREVKKMQRVNRGMASHDLARLTSEEATAWLEEQGLPCSAFAKHRSDYVKLPIESKHLVEVITEDQIFEGAELVPQDIEASPDLPPLCKSSIRTAVTGALESLRPHRPEVATSAQWSQALADTALRLSSQMVNEAMVTEEHREEEFPADDKEWRYEAKAEIVAHPPAETWQLAVTLPASAEGDTPVHAGFVKFYGQLRPSNVDASDSNYPRTPEEDSEWVPIEGRSRRPPQPASTLEDGVESGAPTAAAPTMQQGRRSYRQWFKNRLPTCRLC